MAVIPFRPNCPDLHVQVSGDEIVVSMRGTHRTPLSVGYRKQTGARSLTRTYSWLPLLPAQTERSFERRVLFWRSATAREAGCRVVLEASQSRLMRKAARLSIPPI